MSNLAPDELKAIRERWNGFEVITLTFQSGCLDCERNRPKIGMLFDSVSQADIPALLDEVGRLRDALQALWTFGDRATESVAFAQLGLLGLLTDAECTECASVLTVMELSHGDDIATCDRCDIQMYGDE